MLAVRQHASISGLAPGGRFPSFWNIHKWIIAIHEWIIGRFGGFIYLPYLTGAAK
jgi:hypothetical protein